MLELRSHPSRWVVGALLLLVVGGCGGSSGTNTNAPPIVDAGPAQAVTERTVVDLVCTASDADGVVASIDWTQTSGPPVTLASSDADTATFKAPQVPVGGTQALVFTAIATDNGGRTASDTVTIIVTSNDFVVYRSDPMSGAMALWRANVEPGSLGHTELSDVLVAGGYVASFEFSPDGLHVAYLASQEAPTVLELYVANTDGSGTPVKVSKELPVGGNVAHLFMWAPDNSRLVYRADADTDQLSELYSVRPDGTGHVKLNHAITAPGTVSSFLWAPDSSRVLYSCNPDTTSTNEIYTVPANGGGEVKVNHPLPAGHSVGDVTWAPDSSRIAYEVWQPVEFRHELYTALPTGGGSVKINDTLAVGGSVEAHFWAPDSTRIAYLADQDTLDVRELYTSLAGGGGNVKLNDALPVDGDAGFAIWAPDSSRVAYTTDQTTDNTYELYTSLAGGGGTVRLNDDLADGGDVKHFRWAPDGSRIAYSADQDTDSTVELYTALPTGGGSVKLNGIMATGGSLSEYSLKWAPDSSRVSYIADQHTDRIFEVFTSLAGGGGNVKVHDSLHVDGDVTMVLWSPDSSRLLLGGTVDTVGIYELYVASPDGTTPAVKISQPLMGGSVRDSVWRP